MKKFNLFVVLLGGKDAEDKIEAHNLFVGIGADLKSLLPAMRKSWSGATHIDAYMILEAVDGYLIEIKDGKLELPQYPKLIIANIGFYKKGHFSEFHDLIPIVLADEKDKIVERLKKHPDFLDGQNLNDSSRSHLDDKHEILHFDVDDTIDVNEEIEVYSIGLSKTVLDISNKFEIGYIKFSKLEEQV